MSPTAARAAWAGIACALLGACATESGSAVTPYEPADAEADAPEGMTAALRAPDGAAGDAVEAAWMASGPQCGAVLTRSTTLRQDLGPCSGVALEIGADDVTLDCDGHRVIGDVKAEDRAGLRIANCRVDGAIELRETIGTYVEESEMRALDVIDGVGDTVRRSRIGSGPSSICCEGVRFTDNELPTPGSVLLVFGSGVRVSGNDIHGRVEVIGGEGFRVDANRITGGHLALEGATGSRIEHNVLRDGRFGISSLSSSHNRFDGNDAQDADEFGVLLWGGSHANLLRDNIADDNGTNGFWTYDVSDGNVLIDNDACGNGEADLRDEAAGTVLLDNDFCVVDAP